MASSKSLSGPFHSYLDKCLNEKEFKPLSITRGRFRLTENAPGILLIKPDIKETPPPLLLSAGIHGNETAPIELLDTIIQDIVTEQLQPSRPVLFMLGNLQAMRSQTRFVDANLNRLFHSPPQSTNGNKNKEAKRARIIMDETIRFHDQFGCFWHYDLHTAIRESEIEKFALYPLISNRTLPQEQIEFIKASGIEALVLQSIPSSTFSAFTSNHLDAQSFTLELGQVKPFGQNDLNRFEKIDYCLRALIANKPFPKKTKNQLRIYSVVHEIINSGDSFKLNIHENTKNFTSYPRNYVIWEDEENHYRVKEENGAILFPNSKVKKGERAGLILIEEDRF